MFKTKFSIQAHVPKKRSNDHLDIRILNQKKDTLWSWALPKNKTPVKGEQRLAIRTPNHPVPYMYFQGTLDNGDKVSVIDRGECKVLVNKHNLIVVYFRGKKMNGAYNFVKLHSPKRKDSWLITKLKENDKKR